MKKNILGIFFIAVMVLSFSGIAAAKCEGGKCPMKKKMGGECGKSKSQCPITGKIMKKAHFFLENQKALGLKEDQVAAIKAIKMDVKKTEIRQMAEMQVFYIDLKAKLSEPKVDEAGLNAMIDSMSSGMASSAKASVAQYVKLKSILTADQMSKAKEIWMQNESGHSGH